MTTFAREGDSSQQQAEANDSLKKESSYDGHSLFPDTDGVSADRDVRPH